MGDISDREAGGGVSSEGAPADSTASDPGELAAGPSPDEQLLESDPELVGLSAAARTTGVAVLMGGLWNSFSRVVPQAVSLVISVAAARYLGPDGLGRQSFIAFTMISLVQSIGNGLKESLMRSIAEATGANRPGAIRGMVRWGTRILLAGGVAGGAVLVVAGLLGASPTVAWMLAGIECVLLVASGVPWSVLTGSQKWRQASGIGAISGVVSIPLTIAVLAAGGGITGMFAVELALAGVTLTVITMLAAKTLRALPQGIEHAPDLRRRTKRYAILATAMTFATFVVWQRSEFFFLQSYSTDRQLAFYSISFAAVNALALIPGALAATLGPAFATLYGADDRDRIRSGYWRAQRLLPVISLPLMAGFATLGPALIRVVYGHTYSPTEPVLLILLALFPLLPAMVIAGSLLTGTGSLAVALVCDVVAGAVTIGLNFALVPSHAAIGAALADIGGQVVFVIPVVAYASTRVRPADFDLFAIARAVGASTAAGLAVWVIEPRVAGALGLLAGAVAGVLVFLPLMRLMSIVPRADREWVRTTMSSRFGERAARVTERLVGRGT